jgi:hypothetical protein
MSILPGSHSIQLLLSSDGMGGMGMALADFLTDDLIFDQANAYYG